MNNLRIAVIFLLAIAFIISNWMMDLSNNCMIDSRCYMSNGFWIAEPIKAFHISWYMSIGIFLLMSFLALFPEKLLHYKPAYIKNLEDSNARN